MASRDPGEPASTGEVPVPEKRSAQRDGLPVLIIRVTAVLALAWFCALVLVGWWLVRAVL